ncbi:hypothetical protein VZT92_011967 [Zoarces viviparus]|uniref:Adrenomedullin n=1 Tax=Zoarces viviparus TaxID=48416 RepID=A0AAW1FA89_ZOAVI
MVSSKSPSSFWDFLGSPCGMEIAVLLLLIVPLSAATPLRPTHRSDADVVVPGDTVQAPGVKRTEETQKQQQQQQQQQHAPSLKIIPFHSEDKHLGLEALRHSVRVKLRLRRASQRGCQLGTCQLHNLANTLYQIRKKNGTDESKNANDPHGFGR